MTTTAGTVWVEAPARLHLGVLDMRGDLGREFGGMGVAVGAPSLLLEASAADGLEVDGADAERMLAYARRFLDHHGIAGGARLRLHRAIPSHAGLGSGTQLALATARALAALHDLPTGAGRLAGAVGRARRSAVGTWAFERGGFLLEGGRRRGLEGPAPLLFARPMPERWRCVIAIPDVERGLSGSEEEAAFRTMPAPRPELVGHIARLVLMMMLPSLVEEDLPGFGRAVTGVQRLVGESFAGAQGGVFAHPVVARLVERMLEHGAAGAGQSSWGPTVYGFVEGEAQAQALAARMRDEMEVGGSVLAVGFDNHGARCCREPPDVAAQPIG